MDEAVAILDRLERIDRLRREGAPGVTLLPELRALLQEAEQWSRAEGGDPGEQAVARLRAALARDMVAAYP